MLCVCVYLYGLDVYMFFLSSVIGLQGEIEMDWLIYLKELAHVKVNIAKF